MSRTSVLPASAAKISRVLEQIIIERLNAIERDIKDFHNPMSCRADLLPYLAWQHNVTLWDDNWPIETQRRVVAMAKEMHQYKGTQFAIEHYLDALNVHARVINWFEPNGSGVPMTAEIKTYVSDHPDGDTNQPVLNEQTVNLISDVVQSVKRESVNVNLSVGVHCPSELTIAAAGRVHGRLEMLFDNQFADVEAEQLITVAAAGRVHGRLEMLFNNQFADVEAEQLITVAVTGHVHGRLAMHFQGVH